MPSGRNHEIINLSSLAGLGGLYGLARALGQLAPQSTPLSYDLLGAFTLSFLVGTFLVTPDLDLAENKVRPKDNWGLLRWLWIPYGKMFKHRGLSHTWLLGPLTRLLYIFAWLIILMGLAFAGIVASAMAGLSYEIVIIPLENWLNLLLGATLGFYLSQWLHLIADGVKPDHGWRRRKKSKPRTRSKK
jgi:uncharacterized metal-binding protein